MFPPASRQSRVHTDGIRGTVGITRPPLEEASMKKLLVLGSVLCGVLAMASPAAAAKSSITCTSMMTDVSARDVNVPAGQSCILVDSSVRNDVRVREGS